MHVDRNLTSRFFRIYQWTSVSARDPNTSNCEIILKGSTVFFPFSHVTYSPQNLSSASFNELCSFTLQCWYLGDQIEPHLSSHEQGLQNSGSAWERKSNLWHFTEFMLFFLIQDRKHVWWLSSQQIILSSMQIISIWNDTLKRAKSWSFSYVLCFPICMERKNMTQTSEWLQLQCTEVVEDKIGFYLSPLHQQDPILYPMLKQSPFSTAQKHAVSC